MKKSKPYDHKAQTLKEACDVNTKVLEVWVKKLISANPNPAPLSRQVEELEMTLSPRELAALVLSISMMTTDSIQKLAKAKAKVQDREYASDTDTITDIVRSVKMDLIDDDPEEVQEELTKRLKEAGIDCKVLIAPIEDTPIMPLSEGGVT